MKWYISFFSLMNRKQFEGIIPLLRIFYLNFWVYKNQWCFKICLYPQFPKFDEYIITNNFTFSCKIGTLWQIIESYYINWSQKYLESSLILLFLSVLKYYFLWLDYKKFNENVWRYCVCRFPLLFLSVFLQGNNIGNKSCFYQALGFIFVNGMEVIYYT